MIENIQPCLKLWHSFEFFPFFCFFCLKFYYYNCNVLMIPGTLGKKWEKAKRILYAYIMSNIVFYFQLLAIYGVLFEPIYILFMPILIYKNRDVIGWKTNRLTNLRRMLPFSDGIIYYIIVESLVNQQFGEEMKVILILTHPESKTKIQSIRNSS